MDDWNDLKLVLAIHRANSLVSAAKALGVNHSTAFRRLEALEDKLGSRLFERMPGGVYQATGIGIRMAEAADRVERETAAIDRELAGADALLSGRVKVTTSESLAYALLAPAIARFRQDHPEVILDVMVENRALDLGRRETDVAIRAFRPEQTDLFGRKLSDLAWSIYGRRDLFGHVEGFNQASQQPFIVWEDPLNGFKAGAWLESRLPPENIVLRTNSVLTQLMMVRSGAGVAALPCYLGDIHLDLVRIVPEPVPELATELWAVTHEDLSGTIRVRTFMREIGAFFVSERALLEGRIS